MRVPKDVTMQGSSAVEEWLMANNVGFKWVPLVDTPQGASGQGPDLQRMLVTVDRSLNRLRFDDGSTILASEPIGLNSALRSQDRDMSFYGSFDYFSESIRGMFGIAHDASTVEFIADDRDVNITALLLPKKRLLGFSPSSSIAIELKKGSRGGDRLYEGIGAGAVGTLLARYIIKGDF